MLYVTTRRIVALRQDLENRSANDADEAAASRLPRPTAKDALTEATIRHVAEYGIDRISLRSVAAEVGATTAAIVHHFKNKDGLLLAAAEQALACDRRNHEAYIAALPPMPMNAQVFADFISAYLELQRQNSYISRFWLEALFHSQTFPVVSEALGSWHASRVEFWRDILKNAENPAIRAQNFTSYIVAEEAFSCALHENPTYALIVRETARCIASAIFDIDNRNSPDATITNWLKNQSLRFPIVTEPDASSMRERLLSHAAAAIRRKGTGAISQRHLAKLAGASPSMIVYHFGDMHTFAQEAIWRALLHRLPHEFDPEKSVIDRAEDRSHWARRMADMICPAPDGAGDAGFYVGYSRLTGQATLLASHQPELTPLVYHLRCLEGFGTYRLRDVIWPKTSAEVGYIEAAAFGMWIKGEAVVNEAIRSRNCTTPEDILGVTNIIA